MAMIVQLGAPAIDNPFVKVLWDVDFAAGGAPDLAFLGDHSDPVATYIHFGGDRFWQVYFDPAVNWSALDGKNVADLITDGATILGYYGKGNRLLMTDFAENVSGGNYDDVIDGRGGDDHLIGGLGKDWLAGGPGDDMLEGSGQLLDFVTDAFVFNAALPIAGVDHIVDFSGRKGDRDQINLDVSVFDAFEGAGRLKEKHFDVGNRKPDDGDDFLIYHRKSGSLFYDEDGSRKAHDPIKFAVLDETPKLVARDFVLID